MKNKINICVMSRLEALNYCNTIQNEPSVIISISTPHNDYEYSVFKSKTNMVTDILELSFFDADEQRSINIADDYAVTRELMTDKDAKLITEFADKYKDILLIVHCDEGV